MAIVGEKELNIESITWEGLTWVNIEKPTTRETDCLAQKYGFHELDLDDCLSRMQRPKMDEYPNYLFLVLHFPVFNREARVTTPSQVSVFIGRDYLITLHAGDLKPLVKMFRDCQLHERAREENMGKGSGHLLYQIMDRLVNYCFPILNKVIENVERVEDEVFDENVRETIREISIIRRDVIAFRRIIRPQIDVIKSLEQRERSYLGENMEVYFGDIGDHLEKIAGALDDYKEVIEGLKDTSDTLTSHRTNEVMRLLTIIATIMLPVAVVAGILGMNIYPLTSTGGPLSLVIAILVIAGICGGMLIFFRRKRWI